MGRVFIIDILHAALDGGGAENGSEHGDDELNNSLPGFFLHCLLIEILLIIKVQRFSQKSRK
jgi:hypothetical protein